MNGVAGIEVGGAGSGVDGLGSAPIGSAASGRAGQGTATLQGTAQGAQANAESFRSRWQTFLDSLGAETAGLNPREPSAEENLDSQTTEKTSGESGRTQASLAARSPAALPSSTEAGLENPSAEDPARSVGPDRADSMAGNETAARAQMTVSGGRAQIGSTQPVAELSADSGKGIKRKADAEGQASARIAAHEVTAPGLNATEVVASLAAIPGTLQALPARSSLAADGSTESLLKGPSLESDGALVGSRAGVRLGIEQGTGSSGAQLPNGAAAAALAPVASSSMSNEARAASGEGLAAHEGASASYEMHEIGFQEAASAPAHVTGNDAASAGEQNRNRWSFQSESNLAAGADGSLAGGQPDCGTQATDAGSLAAAEIVGGGKIQPALESQAPGQVVRRTARTSGAAEAAQPGMHSPSLQSAGWGEADGAGAVGAVLAHDLGGGRGAPDVLRESASASADGAATGARETFAALDAGGGPGTMNWVHAGPQRAEAGFQDPALGWVGVRADWSRGAVHAAVLAESSEAAQALGGHMAGLNSYLTEHHAGVALLTMASPDTGSANWGGSPGAMQQGSGGHAAQNGAFEPRTNGSSSPASAARGAPAPSSGLEAPEPELGQARHISVMA